MYILKRYYTGWRSIFIWPKIIKIGNDLTKMRSIMYSYEKHKGKKYIYYKIHIDTTAGK